MSNGKCINRPLGQSITTSSNGQIICHSGYSYIG